MAIILCIGIASIACATLALLFPSWFDVRSTSGISSLRYWTGVIVGYLFGACWLGVSGWAGTRLVRRARLERRDQDSFGARRRSATDLRDDSSEWAAVAARCAPRYFEIDQSTLRHLTMPNAFARAWVSSRWHRATLSFGDAYPEATPEQLDRLSRRIAELDGLVGRWCSAHWGRADGIPLEVFAERMSQRFPEFSGDAIDDVISWNMFLAR